MITLNDLKEHKTYYYINWPYVGKKEGLPFYKFPSVRSFRIASDEYTNDYLKGRHSRTEYYMKKYPNDLVMKGAIQNSSRSSINGNPLAVFKVVDRNNHIDHLGTIKSLEEKDLLLVGDYSLRPRGRNTFYYFENLPDAYNWLLDRLSILIDRTKESLNWVNNQLLDPNLTVKTQEVFEGESINPGDKIWYAKFDLTYTRQWNRGLHGIVDSLNITPDSTLITKGGTSDSRYGYYLYGEGFPSEVYSRELIISKNEQKVKRAYYYNKWNSLENFKRSLQLYIIDCNNKISQYKNKLEKLKYAV